MNISALTGTLIVSRDPMIDRIGLLYVPDVSQIEAAQGLCLLHSESSTWAEGNLKGRRVVFTKWSDRRFKLDGADLCTIDERDVLAVIEAGDAPVGEAA